MLLEIFGYAD
jgi:hypothetical protein